MASLTKSILEKLIEGPMIGIDLSVAIIKSGYGASQFKIAKNIKEAKTIRRKIIAGSISELGKSHRFYNLLSKLKRGGLVEKTNTKWSITKSGIDKLKNINKRLPNHRYDDTPDSNLKIVIFDIPESRRNIRDWLRKKLKQLKFSMIQKSVWIGKTKIPQRFMKDLKELDIFEYIEIFEITKTGSIKKAHIA